MITNAFDGQTVAVTGAAGFLGGRLIQRLGASNCRIMRVTRRPLPPSGGPAMTDVVGDVGEASLWERVVNEAGVVFHFAGQTSTTVAADDPAADFRANVVPMRHLVAASRKLNRQPIVVFAGTVTQAGIPSRVPVDEDAPDDPVTVYDRHKLIAEGDLESAAVAGVVFGATLRLANVYGPGSGQHPERDVMNRMIKAALDGHDLTVYGSGEFLRDYIFVDDVVEAFLLAAVRVAEVNARHFVVGSGIGTRIRDAFELIASRVEALTGRRVPVTLAEPGSALSAIDQRHFIANPARFMAATGWRPTYSLATGIDRTIEAYACA